jgi:hypothetical protein
LQQSAKDLLGILTFADVATQNQSITFTQILPFLWGISSGTPRILSKTRQSKKFHLHLLQNKDFLRRFVTTDDLPKHSKKMENAEDRFSYFPKGKKISG